MQTMRLVALLLVLCEVSHGFSFSSSNAFSWRQLTPPSTLHTFKIKTTALHECASSALSTDVISTKEKNNVLSALNTTNVPSDESHNVKIVLENSTQKQLVKVEAPNPKSVEKLKPPKSSSERFFQAFPRIASGGDELDRSILATTIPSMINLAVVPIVNSVDTFWVGRMGSALALAGQAASNQAFFTLYFLVAFLPTITAPLVAAAVASNDKEAAQSRVCEALFLGNVLGGLGTLLLVGFPRVALSMVLPADAPALEYAAPYLRWRALSMIPALVSATGFAAYRGLLNTVTPLKVSLATNAINLVLDPLAIFVCGFGFVGAAFATALSEFTSGIIYLKLLLRKKLARWSLILKPPSWARLLPLLQGGATMLARQAALNVGFVAAARRAQTMDPTGVAAAAYGIVMQMYAVGIVVHVAVQGTAAALVPSALAKGGNDQARAVADRLFSWGSIVGVLLGVTQWVALPFLVPLFSTLPEVQKAVRIPALIACLIHVINGPVLAGEGVMLGLSRYKELTTVTSLGIGTMVACLASPLGKRLDGILLSMAAFCLLQAVGVLADHLRFGPLSRREKK